MLSTIIQENCHFSIKRGSLRQGAAKIPCSCGSRADFYNPFRKPDSDSKKHKKGDVYTKKVPDGSGKMGGTLRRGWSIGAMEKRGNMYCIEVINPTFYASYVEYGHRQQPGRYVPAIGKRLKEGWVKGKFMLTISEQELDSQAPSILEKKLTQFLKNCIE